MEKTIEIPLKYQWYQVIRKYHWNTLGPKHPQTPWNFAQNTEIAKTLVDY